MSGTATVHAAKRLNPVCRQTQGREWGGRGRGHAKLLAGRDDVEVAYVCDPDLKRAEQAAAEVEKASGKRPKGE